MSYLLNTSHLRRRKLPVFFAAEGGGGGGTAVAHTVLGLEVSSAFIRTLKNNSRYIKAKLRKSVW